MAVPSLSAILEGILEEVLRNFGGVGVLEDDGCIISTQFEGGGLEVVPDQCAHRAACCDRTGEGNMIDAGVRNEVTAGFVSASKDLEDSRGQVGS